MGNLTFDVMKELVKFKCGNNTAPESIGTQEINLYGVWVNWAYKQLCIQDHPLGMKNRIYIPELETSTTLTLSSGDYYKSVPNDVLTIRTIYNTTTERKLTWKGYREYLALSDRQSSTTTGEPTIWTRAGNYIYFYPASDSTYSVEVYYKKLPTALTGTATTEIGEEWDEVIILWAAFKALLWLHDYDKAKEVRMELLETLAGMVNVQAADEVDAREVLRPDPQLTWNKTR